MKQKRWSRAKTKLTGWLESDDLLATRHSWLKVASQISKATTKKKKAKRDHVDINIAT